MVEVFGQAVAILWVVTDDVLPLVASIAGDGVAIILVEAAYAVDLAVVLLLGGGTLDVAGLAFGASTAMAILWAGAVTFRRLERRFADDL